MEIILDKSLVHHIRRVKFIKSKVFTIMFFRHFFGVLLLVGTIGPDHQAYNEHYQNN